MLWTKELKKCLPGADRAGETISLTLLGEAQICPLCLQDIDSHRRTTNEHKPYMKYTTRGAFLTRYSFLQVLIITTQTNLMKEIWVEFLKSFNFFQPCEDYIHIFTGSFQWPMKGRKDTKSCISRDSLELTCIILIIFKLRQLSQLKYLIANIYPPIPSQVSRVLSTILLQSQLLQIVWYCDK